MDSYPHAPAPGQTETSIEAAASLEGVTARVQQLVLAEVRRAGSCGRTACELAVALGMERTTVQPRTTELRLLRKIADSGKRRPNPNGKRAIVWVAREDRQHG